MDADPRVLKRAAAKGFGATRASARRTLRAIAVLILASCCGGCVRDAVSEPLPEWGSVPPSKHECPDGTGTTPCGDDQYCLDYHICGSLGSSREPECGVEPEGQYGISASLLPPYPKPTGSLKGVVEGSQLSGFTVKVDIGSTSVRINNNLPPDMPLPIAQGDTVSLQLCAAAAPPNVYAVRATDAAGQLLFAGGHGGAPDTSCFGSGTPRVIAKELGCGVHRPSPPFAEMPYLNFALEFRGDTSITLPQRGRGSLKQGGKSYLAANFVSIHLVEWGATDVSGPLEHFAVVRKP